MKLEHLRRQANRAKISSTVVNRTLGILYTLMLDDAVASLISSLGRLTPDSSPQSLLG